MEIKEAYVTNVVCHHFSADPTECLVNNSEMDISRIDADILKKFFIKPFGKIKAQYNFSHHVSLSYNIVYQSILNIFRNGDFVKASKDIFNHLKSVSSTPQIKDGDIFITQIDDIMIDEVYCEAVGIFKIESKSDFIETFVDGKGNMQLSIKQGFTSNKIDKACLIVLAKDAPVCFVIDSSRDSKFWYQDFLGVIPKVNSYSQSKVVMKMLQDFITKKLPKETPVAKDEQVKLINKCVEEFSNSTTISVEKAAQNIFGDSKTVEMFSEYRKAYEEKEQLSLQDSFEVDRKAMSVTKTQRRMKLDDTAEIYLMKTGNFIERGYDEERGMNYYKIYFSKEK